MRSHGQVNTHGIVLRVALSIHPSNHTRAVRTLSGKQLSWHTSSNVQISLDRLRFSRRPDTLTGMNRWIVRQSRTRTKADRNHGMKQRNYTSMWWGQGRQRLEHTTTIIWSWSAWKISLGRLCIILYVSCRLSRLVRESCCRIPIAPIRRHAAWQECLLTSYSAFHWFFPILHFILAWLRVADVVCSLRLAFCQVYRCRLIDKLIIRVAVDFNISKS